VNFTALLIRSATASKKKVAVALHDRLICRFHLEGDVFVLSDRILEITDIVHQWGGPDATKSVEAAAMFDLGNLQMRNRAVTRSGIDRYRQSTGRRPPATPPALQRARDRARGVIAPA
jgi:hypothetical protein